MNKYYLDKFYTKKEVVQYILKFIDINIFKTIIEPSAGNGAFSNEISNCIAYDIEPEENNIIQENFLKIHPTVENPCLVIGNPPFGRNGSMALKFIKHACSFADLVAFILPRGFKKQSYYDKIPLDFWKKIEVDLNDNSFIYNRKDFKIPCVFQVYEKRNELRRKKEKLQPKTFTFTKKENANISFRRVGANAGFASIDTNKSDESHYFLFSTDPEKLINKIHQIQWKHNNTTGPKSISKQELIQALEH